MAGAWRCGGYVGKLLLGEGWASNGHWLINGECFTRPARATKWIQTQGLAPAVLSNLQEFACMSRYHCTLTGERISEDRPVPHSSKKIERVCYASFASKEAPAGVLTWGQAHYIDWLSALGGSWFMGTDHTTPLVLKRDGETLAILMPVARPRL
jgi:hypothetical protein